MMGYILPIQHLKLKQYHQRILPSRKSFSHIEKLYKIQALVNEKRESIKYKSHHKAMEKKLTHKGKYIDVYI